ncbi:MAG: class I SAM-dependent methyltransferase [Terriglobia bacterium]
MFFKKLVNDYKLKSFLDVGCSTGFHVIMFRRLGLDATGIDASSKMIEKARANSVTCGVTVEFILGDFFTMSKRFSEGFDIVTLLGDTTSFLKTGQEVKKAFQEIYKCLNPGGLFVLQTRNYDHILKNRLRFMPPTFSRNGSEETLFFRLLDYAPKSIQHLLVKYHWHENRWDSSVLTTLLSPHLKKDLEKPLKSLGFSKVSCYRNFNFEDFDPNGQDLIIVAEKKGTLKGRTTPVRAERPRKETVSPKPPIVKPLKGKASPPAKAPAARKPSKSVKKGR